MFINKLFRKSKVNKESGRKTSEPFFFFSCLADDDDFYARPAPSNDKVLSLETFIFPLFCLKKPS